MLHGSPRTNIPELLAPGAGLEGIRAAVAGGADAVYFGLTSGFNARSRAANISPAALPEMVDWLHDHRVRAYVAFNTLVFTGELDKAEDSLRVAIEAGVDALIVQDLGIARLIREISPNVPIHASTQMTLSCAEAIETAAELDLRRVILPRELRLQQIESIAAATSVELEVFVHGALCISFGGQCLASAALGGRSANRGECAQACRLPYEAFVDGQPLPSNAERYILSARDLAGWRQVPALAAAGVTSLKIEGRLKSPEYVAFATAFYRRAIDSVKSGVPFQPTEEDRNAMEQLFSRGFCQGWLGGCSPQELVDGRTWTNRGVPLGRVEVVRGGRFTVRLRRPLRRGDGVAFVPNAGESLAGDDAEDGPCDGGRIYEIMLSGESVMEASAGQRVEVALGRDQTATQQLQSGDLVLKTDDARLGVQLRRSYQGELVGRRVPLDLEVHAQAGYPLRLLGQCDNDARCVVQSDAPLDEATRHPLTEDVLREQFGRLGGSGYELRSIRSHVGGEPMVPFSVLGSMRREMIRQLDACSAHSQWNVRTPGAVKRLLEPIAAERANSTRTADHEDDRGDSRVMKLHVLCRHLDHIDVALRCDVEDLILDFRDLKEVSEGIRRVHAGGGHALVATPRVMLPGDAWSAARIVRHGADGLLARHLAAAGYCRQYAVPFVADASLGAVNPLTVDYLRRLGAARVTASHDLDRAHLLAMVDAAVPGWLEVVVHQHMPMFFMDYCLPSRLLSDSSDRATCCRPSATHTLRLRDRRGKDHPVAIDGECRCTVYSAATQSGAELVPLLMARGIRHFRIELLADTPVDRVEALLRVYRDLLDGRTTGQIAWSRLGSLCPDGLTRGTLASARETGTKANRRRGARGDRRR